MASSFRKLFVVLREAPGSYQDGVWQAGARSIVSIMASVQPVKARVARDEQDMQALTEGRRSSDRVKIYSDTELVLADATALSQSDLIIFEGAVYEIVQTDKYRSDVINHYRHEAIRRGVSPGTVAWLNGTYQREGQ